MKNALLTLALVAATTLAASAAPSTPSQHMARSHMAKPVMKAASKMKPATEPSKMKPSHAMMKSTMKPYAMTTHKP